MTDIKTLLLYTRGTRGTNQRGTHQRGTCGDGEKSLTHELTTYEPGSSAIFDLENMKIINCPSFTIPNSKLALATDLAIFLFENEEQNNETSKTKIYDVASKKLINVKSLFNVRVSDGYYVYEPTTETEITKTYLYTR